MIKHLQMQLKKLGLYYQASYVLSIVMTLYIMLSLCSYRCNDQSLFVVYDQETVRYNWAGTVGASCAALFFYFFGATAYLFIILLPLLVYLMFHTHWRSELDRLFAAGLFVIACAGMGSWSDVLLVNHGFVPGGLIGSSVCALLSIFFDSFLVWSFLTILMIISIILLFRLSGMQLMYYGKISILFLYHHSYLLKRTFLLFLCFMRSVFFYIKRILLAFKALFDGSVIEQSGESLMYFEYDIDDETELVTEDALLKQQTIMHETAFEASETSQNMTDEQVSQKYHGASPASMQSHEYELPSAKMLIFEKNTDTDRNNKQMQELARILEHKLERFGIVGRVVSIKQGPVITLFEYEPAVDAKISKIIALEDDLALALQAQSIRIIAPVPGKKVVGFEVACQDRQMVWFAQIVQMDAFVHDTAVLPLVLGVDTVGKPVIVDLTKMPHLLVAGATGSGKSVALHAMLSSLLYRRTPVELKLILIDPKRLEFAPYQDIPHLLFPIIADAKQAVAVLNWVIDTMHERYELMAQAHVRNIIDYHKKQVSQEPLPYIVIIIDELSDLMMSSGKDTELAIARIAQMARAAGIHLILATQRPSVDVITGIIKANFPSRIAFKVATKIDSRTILDISGADKLLGKGDMLYMDAGSHVHRIHGSYITDEHVMQIAQHARAQQIVQYLEIPSNIDANEDDISETDQQLYQEVLAFIRSVDEISISLIQRKFRIGYNRSARIIELLERQGLILPNTGGRTRKVIK